MLFEPGRHEPLQRAAWDSARARDAIRALAADLEASRNTQGLWPVHPLDDEGDEPRGGWRGLYLGGAGVLWALWFLQRQRAIETGIELGGAIDRVHAAYLEGPDTGTFEPSYFLGDAGILLVRWLLTGADDRLEKSLREGEAHAANEGLLGAPGVMLAALHLWRATSNDRWRQLFVEGAERLWAGWAFDAETGLRLWPQRLAGAPTRYLGAAHGFAGNASVLLEGASLLEPARREALWERCEAVFRTTAQVDDGAVNWPPELRATGGAQKRLVQWCHGAPGVITSLAAFPRGRSPQLDALLDGAGELVWLAGPLTKGPGLCHGTAGSGAALLSLYRRTGEHKWLHRARSFAMHALEQQAHTRRAHGRPRPTLWTGDAGVAVFVWQCLEGVAGLPLLDLV
jgi:Lanthionine synthetase C-like protein